MRRTLDDWHDSIATTMSNEPGMGWKWAILTLLSQIALILLDIRESAHNLESK